MAVLTKHRFTTSEYYRMAETGLLKPSERVELLDGEIIDMSPIGPFHGGLVNRLARMFQRLAENRFLVIVQNPVHLDEYSDPQPDITIAKPRPDDYITRHPGPEDVLLLIEVADTSLAYDRDEKLPAYGRAGIAEVWIVNLGDRTIEVYREPYVAGYNSRQVLRAGESARSLAFPDVSVDIAGLLKQG